MAFITLDILELLEKIAASDIDEAKQGTLQNRNLPRALGLVFANLLMDSSTSVPDLTYDFANRMVSLLGQIDLSALINSDDKRKLFDNILSKIEEHQDLKEKVAHLRQPITPDKIQIEDLLLSENDDERRRGITLLKNSFNNGDANFDAYTLEILTELLPVNADDIYEFFCRHLLRYPLNQNVAELMTALESAFTDLIDESDEPEVYEQRVRFLISYAEEYAKRNPSIRPATKKNNRSKAGADAHAHTNVICIERWKAPRRSSAPVKTKKLPEQMLEYWLKIPREQRSSALPHSICSAINLYERVKEVKIKSINEIKEELRKLYPTRLNVHSTLDDYINETDEDDDSGYYSLLTLTKELLDYFSTPDAITLYQQKKVTLAP